MKKKYTFKCLLFVSVSFLLFAIASCKKDNNNNKTNVIIVDATPAKIGLYEVDSSIYKLLFIEVSQIGTYTLENDLLFDTGSGGMVLDAEGILPKSMITSTGFTFTGDSTVVDGITVTNQKNMIEYGDDDSTTTKVYGNLAYASVTIGDANGNIVVKRLPFFLYYKATNPDGSTAEAHDFDTFGVSQEDDVTFGNNVSVTSPFSYYTPGTGLTSGFKLAALGTSNFSYEGNYVDGVITVGLTSSDLASSSGFVMHQLTFYTGDGYAPVLPATITYNGKSTNTDVVFDTGTEPYSYIEDKTVPGNTALLPVNSSVTVATTSGFSYSYTVTATDNLTFLENPITSGADVSIISLEYFLNNEYLLDYTNHKLGLKIN